MCNNTCNIVGSERRSSEVVKSRSSAILLDVTSSRNFFERNLFLCIVFEFRFLTSIFISFIVILAYLIPDINKEEHVPLIKKKKKKWSAILIRSASVIRRLRSDIHCEYSISIMHVTYAINFEYSQWISERTHSVTRVLEKKIDIGNSDGKFGQVLSIGRIIWRDNIRGETTVIMVSASSVVAHLVKLLVTAVCMRHLAEPYRVETLPIMWCLRAFRILFMHSILGIFRFGKINVFNIFNPVKHI